MKLQEFLQKKTNVNELCAIRNGGWTVATCHIDNEDLFYIPPKLAEKEVKSDKWGYLPIVNENNACIKIPCHYVDV